MGQVGQTCIKTPKFPRPLRQTFLEKWLLRALWRCIMYLHRQKGKAMAQLVSVPAAKLQAGDTVAKIVNGKLYRKNVQKVVPGRTTTRLTFRGERVHAIDSRQPFAVIR